MQPTAQDMLTKQNASFTISDNYRFGVLFANGWRLSLGIGSGHYCVSEPTDNGYISQGCEIAIFTPKNEMITFKDGDQVLSHVTPEKLTEVMQWITSQPPA